MAVKVREVRGIWRVMVDWKGRRVSRNVGRGKDGKRSAEQSAQQIAAKLALGDASVLSPPPPPAAVLTFRTYVERWLTTTVPLRCKASTVDRYRSVLARQWTPVFGDLPLTAITRDRIKAELARLAATHQADSIRGNLLVALQACLSAAVEDGWLPANPAARLGRYIRSDKLPQERLDPFTREELAHLLATAETDMPEWFPFYLTLARTGLRIGEAIALRPEDLDFRARCLWVRRAAYKGRVSTPKNGKGRRVDMSLQLTKTLQGWLTLREAEAVVQGTARAPGCSQGRRGRCSIRPGSPSRSGARSSVAPASGTATLTRPGTASPAC